MCSSDLDAYPDVDLRMTLHGFGFDEFLVRPLSVQEVYHRSRIYLEKKTLEQQKVVREETLEPHSITWTSLSWN